MISRLVAIAVGLFLVVAFTAGFASAAPSYVSNLYVSYGSREGDVLTINPGTWEHTPPLAFSYQWFHVGSPTLIATEKSHTVAASDIGKKIFVVVTATDPTGSSSVNSGEVGPFRYRPPVNITKPTIAGRPAIGNTLTANPGAWALSGSATGPISYVYRWYRNWSYMGGGTEYVLTDADEGAEIRLEVQARIPDGAGGTAYGYADAVVTVESPPPTVTSNIRAGDVLTGTRTWIIEAPAGTKAVEFWKESTQLHVDTAVPFTYQLDTTKYPNGRTHLGMAFTTADDVRHKQQVGYVTFDNKPPDDALKSSIAAGAVLAGYVMWEIQAPDGTQSVEFWKDNVRLKIDQSKPFTYQLDTTKYPNGRTHLGMAFTDQHGVRHKQQVGNVTINNSFSPPPTGGNGTAPGTDTPGGGAPSEGDSGDGGVAGATASLIVGTNGANRLLGTQNADTIRGRKGNDTLLGFEGPDRLFGGKGRDILRGNQGTDRLNGGAQADRLFGGGGRDYLKGGLGNDRLKGGSGKDTFLAGRGNDKIWARDGIAEIIKGGPGRDVAIVDRFDIVIGCEVVRRA